MADASGTWDAATLSTVSSISKFEKEITELVSVGELTYSVNAGNVASAITPTALNVADMKGTLEVIAIAATQCVFSGFSVSVTDSDDDDTYSAYGTGLILYSKTGTVAAGTVLFKWIVPSDIEDYFKPAITVGTSTGTISIYANSIWDNKIALAKSILGTDLALLLNNNQLRKCLDEDDNVLDSIYNPTALGLVSDFKTLELIYSDLARGSDAQSLFWQKSKEYRNKYEIYLQKTAKMLTIDLYQDAGTLIYYSDLNYVSQAGR